MVGPTKSCAALNLVFLRPERLPCLTQPPLGLYTGSISRTPVGRALFRGRAHSQGEPHRHASQVRDAGTVNCASTLSSGDRGMLLTATCSAAGAVAILTIAMMPTNAGGAEALTLDRIHLRDPYILPVPQEGKYYLFGTGWTLPDGPGFMVYTSTDLQAWHGPRPAFTCPDGFSSVNYWAPEVHLYRGRYYMFATFFSKTEDSSRNTRILVAEEPGGPYRFHSPGPVTPRDWYCLDGTLFVDQEGLPWMVFCHEWVQIGDGSICAVRLSEDLRQSVGEPVVLFKASAAPWVTPIGTAPRGRVTDGPFLHRAANGDLLMLWSSFGEGGYKLAVARSESGVLLGPWTHPPKPLYEDDGGHGMLLLEFGGQLLLVLHQPNSQSRERPRIFSVHEHEQATLTLSPWPSPTTPAQN